MLVTLSKLGWFDMTCIVTVQLSPLGVTPCFSIETDDPDIKDPIARWIAERQDHKDQESTYKITFNNGNASTIKDMCQLYECTNSKQFYNMLCAFIEHKDMSIFQPLFETNALPVKL